MKKTTLKNCLISCSIILMSSAVYAESTYFKVGTLIDVLKGKTLNNQVIEVENDRIISVSSPNKVKIPANAMVTDLSAYTVLPGLLDMHVHLTSNPNKHGYRRLESSIPRQALYGAYAAKNTVMAGFTTVRNLGAAGFADVALRDSINDGEVLGPRMRVSGPTLCMTGGHCDNNLLPPEYDAHSAGATDGPYALKGKVRNNIRHGADVIKFTATGGVLSKNTNVNAAQFDSTEMSALISEAHDRYRKVAAHAHGAEGIKRAIRAGVDSIEHASLIDAEGLKLAKKNGTYLVMDVYVSSFILGEGEKAGILEESLAKERLVGKVQRENFKKAHEMGINIAFGSDAGVYPHGDNGKQFAYMVKWGMTPMEAIQAATSKAAELLDWRNENGQLNVGAIETGRYADFIAVKGNPLKDVSVLENVTVVVKGGNVIKH
jgi:imidazolonepropionase-like amidohydrolase